MEEGAILSRSSRKVQQARERLDGRRSAYDKEAWPELREGLDRNRPEYRKHFPDQGQDQPKAAEG